MSPRALPVDHTYEWLDQTLPRDARRVLEIGCGNGMLAARLQSRGLNVTAIDRSPDAVAETRARGVRAIEADFASFEDAPFDAVVLVRVLHHLDPLEGTVGRLADLLTPDGLLFVEDFSVEEMDAETARWYYDLGALLVLSGLLDREDEAPPPQRELIHWFEHHASHGPVHEGGAMLTALARRFAIARHSQPPYLYRYFCARLAQDSKPDARVADWIHSREQGRIEEGSLRAIGLRIEARKAR